MAEDEKKQQNPADPRKVPLGSGLAERAKKALMGRRRQVDRASGFRDTGAGHDTERGYDKVD